jgi:NTE family protein
MSDDAIDLDDPTPRTAFVLAGGATRGASQVGMLQALTERGIRPDLVVGTSIGALNGASFAQTPTLDGLERLAALWEEPPRNAIFSLSARSIAANIGRRRGYLLGNGGLADWIRVNTSVRRMEDFSIPLHAVATHAETREPVVLSTGDTVQALLASSAIPGMFPPITIDGTRLIDGGSSADVPIRQAVDLGATTVFVLPTSPGGEDPTGRLWLLLDRLFGQPPSAATPSDGAGVHVPVQVHRLPAPRPDPNPATFRSSPRLIAEARAMAGEVLDALHPPRPTTVDLTDPPGTVTIDLADRRRHSERDPDPSGLLRRSS